MTKKKETLPKDVLAQDEYTKEKDEERITQVSLRLDFKARDLTCNANEIAKDAVTTIIDSTDCVCVRAQVTEYKKV